MKKILSFLLKTIGVLVLAIVLFIVGVFVVNKVSNKTELGKIEPYGQKVSVDGKNMNVLIQGKGDETVVLLPGFATAAPGLDFKPLIDQLAPFYKVVVVEPFGYGLSDVTDKERTIDNIVAETHEALQKLNINRYTLMGHSIAGIYGLEYVNKYGNEVKAFVGIDSSFPTQMNGEDEEFPTGVYKFLRDSGFNRLLMKLSPDQVFAPDGDETIKEQVRMISLKNAFNANMLNEGENFTHNFKAAESYSFPKNLPVLFFLVKVNTDVEGWKKGHEEQIKNSAYGKIIELEGEHYLHHTHSKEIAEDFRSFMAEVK
ncbi:alpha/beta hydrolase [Paenibacillus agri]|uniref:Alpha/beta hydrolase n=1 Tax=Paenibacillus agri TaxID=2744309 RepID=A0A850EGM3_9BACL|nr:alpha/beta hydrolase [Paenibacillus agri]NUU60483.1 alpha/beta hydrolase [Paenibacillus agri]